MKYTILFAATAAAYDAYGGYGAQSSSTPAKVSSAPSYDNYGGYGSQSSSTPAKVSSSAPGYGGYGYQPVTSSKASTPASSKATPCSTTVGKNGYTTVVPGYGKPPVTVTSQYQSYPTCVAMGYDGKSCDKWGEDKYVSTTITDYNKKVVTITKVQDYVTVYQEKKTITHYATPTAGGYGAVSTPVSKNGTGVWYELYEKVHVIEYQNMGKNAMVGYTGSGLCQKCDSEQPVVVKEYKGGKWTEEKKTFTYGKPQDEVKVYEKPGVYTVPAKTVTVYKSTPTGKTPEVGVYQYPAKVITITKSNQPYTCTYEVPKQTPSKTPSKNEGYPSTVTKTPTYNNDYGYKASSTPKKPENDYPSYPSYPVKSNTTSWGNGYADKPTSTPCSTLIKSTPTPVTSSKPVYGDYGYGAKSTPTPATSSKPVYGDYGYGDKPSSSVPSKPSSTPCESDKKTPTPTPSKPVYNDNYNDYKPTPTPSKPSYDNGYGGDYKPSPTPSKPSYDNNNGYGGDYKPSPTPSKPVYNDNNGYGGDYKSTPTPTPAYPAYPADPSGGYGSNTQYGKTNTGYTKRGGMIERRNAVAKAQEAKRAIIL